MWIDKRLRCVIDEIDGADTTIDVGTDHGKVIVTAIKEGRTKRGIASDISAMSLAKARELATKSGVALDTRVGDGLSVIKDGEADTCVIAGMGGKEIVKILSDFSGKVSKLILVPHKDAKLVREYLMNNGYAVDKDYMIFESGFYYNIIVATIGSCTLSLRELYFGQNDMTNDTFREYVQSEIARITALCDKGVKSEELMLRLDILKGIDA